VVFIYPLLAKLAKECETKECILAEKGSFSLLQKGENIGGQFK
jgi:hypothetical protein